MGHNGEAKLIKKMQSELLDKFDQIEVVFTLAHLRVGIIGLLRLGGGGGTPDSLADCNETSSTETTLLLKQIFPLYDLL